MYRVRCVHDYRSGVIIIRPFANPKTGDSGKPIIIYRKAIKADVL